MEVIEKEEEERGEWGGREENPQTLRICHGLAHRVTMTTGPTKKDSETHTHTKMNTHTSGVVVLLYPERKAGSLCVCVCVGLIRHTAG